MTDLNLKTFNKLYPMMIRKYSDLIIDQNASEKDKINSIILKLNALGKLSNDVVRDWNTVYQWAMNDGLTQDVNNKLEDMLVKGQLKSITDALVAEIGDLTTLTTPQKDTVVHSINSLQSEVIENAISPFFPPIPYEKIKADGTDVIGDTLRLNNLINYCVVNNKRLVISKNIEVTPTIQVDGSYVCLLVNDEVNNAGNATAYAKGFTIEFIGGATIKSTYILNDYSIIRWKASHGKLKGLRIDGDRNKATGIQLSRKNLNDINELDYITSNIFDDISFYNLKNGMTLEGSVYYSEFRNFHFVNVGQMIWLKLTYALLNGLKTGDSGVNRNNFYNIQGGAVNGIRIDCGDTNKFYNLSFEGLTGTAIELYDSNPPYNVEYTAYNTFYGVTNEANNMNLICNANSNSFIDFESPFSKTNFIKQPLVYIPSGDAGTNHVILNRLWQTSDQDVLSHLKNRNYLDGALNADGFADVVGVDGTGNKRNFDWRRFGFTPAQCTNITSLVFNSASKQAIFKSIGGIVFYCVKFSFVPSDITASIKIPLPELVPSDIYTYLNSIPLGIPVGYCKDNTVHSIIPAIIDGTANIEIKPPTGNWSATSNILLINISYAREMTAFSDTN